MKQHHLDYDVTGPQSVNDPVYRQALDWEKVGTIVGFLIALPIGIGWVEKPLTSVGVPEWLAVLAAALTVAVVTRYGLKVGIAISGWLASRKPPPLT